jgi:hypothetical protein
MVTCGYPSMTDYQIGGDDVVVRKSEHFIRRETVDNKIGREYGSGFV